MKIAAIQMVSAPDLATNLATAERLIDQTVADGAQLVSLPEYFVVARANIDDTASHLSQRP